MELVGYRTSRKEMRDIYHSVYLLRRTPGTSSCGEWERRRVIHDILASLTVRLQRQTQPTATEEWARLGQEGSYKAALQAVCHRVLETAKALCSDLKRLKSGRRRLQAHSRSQSRGRSRACSRTWSRTCSRGQSRDWTRANSQSCHHGDPQGVCPWSPDRIPTQRRVNFHDPNNVKDPVKEKVSNLRQPSVDDLEMWLEFQAGQLGTPMWWEDLAAVPGIEDRHKFARKIRASFYVPEVCLRVSPEQVYTAPPAPQVLDRGAFHPEKFAYQDVREWPILLMIAYARCLPHWVERHNLPKNPDFCPWAECVRELQQTVREFVNITYRDVMQGLELEKCQASCPGMTIFSWVLANPINEPRIVEDTPHLDSPSPKDEAIWCASPPQGLEQHDRYVLVVTLLVGWLGLGAGGNNIGEFQDGRGLFQNPQMSAMLPPPREASCYRGATLTELG